MDIAVGIVAPRERLWPLVPVADTELERADGACAITFSPLAGPGGRTRILDLYQSAPCHVLMPRVEIDEALTAVLLTTSGGLAGGDRIRVAVTAETGAQAVVTSQASEKIYRSLRGDTAVSVTLTAEAGTWLEWIPQGTILFDRSRLVRRTVIDTAAGARVLAGEIVVFGRTAHSETFRDGLLHDAWRVHRDGKLVWADALRLESDIPGVLAHPAGFGGAVAAATILYVADDAPQRIDDARALLTRASGRAGATAVNGVLLVRLLNADAQALMGDVAAFWSGFRARVAGLPACMPRVWQC